MAFYLGQVGYGGEIRKIHNAVACAEIEIFDGYFYNTPSNLNYLSKVTDSNGFINVKTLSGNPIGRNFLGITYDGDNQIASNIINIFPTQYKFTLRDGVSGKTRITHNNGTTKLGKLTYDGVNVWSLIGTFISSTMSCYRVTDGLFYYIKTVTIAKPNMKAFCFNQEKRQFILYDGANLYYANPSGTIRKTIALAFPGRANILGMCCDEHNLWISYIA